MTLGVKLDGDYIIFRHHIMQISWKAEKNQLNIN